MSDEKDIILRTENLKKHFRIKGGRVVKAVDGIESQLIKLEEVRRVLLVMEGCFKSAELGQALEVNI